MRLILFFGFCFSGSSLFSIQHFSKRANLHPESNLIVKLRLLSGCRFFHSWAPAGRENPERVGVP